MVTLSTVPLAESEYLFGDFVDHKELLWRSVYSCQFSSATECVHRSPLTDHSLGCRQAYFRVLEAIRVTGLKSTLVCTGKSNTDAAHELGTMMQSVRVVRGRRLLRRKTGVARRSERRRRADL